MDKTEKQLKKKSEKKDKERAKLNGFEPRSVQTLFRTLLRNHYNLLRMIDNKSSIILTINSIIISLLMGILFISPNANKAEMLLGFRMLTFFCLLSMIFALLSMLPHRYVGKIFRESDYTGSLYAGNFAKLSLLEFQQEFSRIMNNGKNVYDEMIKDLYFLGKSIAFKQKLLVISFLIFMFGLVAVIIYGASTGFADNI